MVRLTDTTLRDAHQSLLATRLRTRDMLPICERLNEAGFHSLEVWGGATYDTCLRFLNESPWERLRVLRKALPDSRLQMLLRGQNLVGYRHYPDDVVERFVTRAARSGIDVFRIFDALNDVRNMELAIRVAKREGREVQGAVCYTLSPVHTVESYLGIFRRLAELGCDSLCIKDMAGLITPSAAEELVGAVKRELSLPLCLHSQCTAGLAPMSYLAAARAGCDLLDTAISPLSGGSSQPAAEAVVAALKGTPWDTGLDLSKLIEIKEYFARVRERYGALIDPISERVDTSVLVYQIPGGMLSNLVSQLKQQGAMDRFREVLEETPRVRAELGYPPLVTPTSQLVGTQAVFNVLCGERYKMASNEIKDYLRGRYGRAPGPVDDGVRRKVIGDEVPITVRPADLLQPEWPRVLEEGRELGLSEEDEESLLLLALFPAVARQFLRGETREEELKPRAAPALGRAGGEGAAEGGAGGGEGRGSGAAETGPESTGAREPVFSARPSPGPKQYLVRVGERVFEVSVEDRACASSRPAVWFPFGISRSSRSRGEPGPASVTTAGPPASSGRARAEESGARARGAARHARTGATPAARAPQPAVSEDAGTRGAPDRAGGPEASPAAPIRTALGMGGGAGEERAGAEGAVRAPMQGLLLKVLCSPGERVRSGQVVAVLEAMKMENEIQAPRAGVVREIRVRAGEQVAVGETIMVIE